MTISMSLSVEEALKQASTEREAGRLDEAERLYRSILKENPQDGEAQKGLHNLQKSNKKTQAGKGNQRRKRKRKPASSPLSTLSERQPDQTDVQAVIALYTAGKLGKAEARALKLIKKFPRAFVVYNLLGAVQAGLGKINEAMVSYEKAIAIRPDFADAHNNLGLIYWQCGMLEKAEASHREALRINPNGPEAHNNLGNVLRDLGRPAQAVASYDQAVRLRPDYAVALSNLGNALKDLGRLEEAAVRYIQALKIDPEYANAYNNLGGALGSLDRFEEAISSYEHAIRIKPDFAEAYNNMGNMYERLNNLDLARKFTEKARSLSPDDPAINRSLAVLYKRGGDIQRAIELLEPFADRSFPDTLLLPVYSELGQLHDLAKDSKKAFEHFSIANDLMAGGELSAAANKQGFLDQIERMDEFLTADWTDSWTPQEDEGDYETPAFLVGFPRSGTTLLDQIMDSHPGLQVMEEKPALLDVILQLERKFGDCPTAIARLDGADVIESRELYFRSAGSHLVREPDTLLVDKLPLQIRYIPLIVRLFPKARVILALRHPCDVVLSNFMQNYKINEAMANFFTLEDAARCYVKVMSLWQKSAELLPVRYHVLKYESLVADFESEVRALLEFLGVGWDDAVRNYRQHAMERGAINTPSYQAVTEPINARAKYRWIRYREQLEPVLDDLSPFIEAFGYSEAGAVGEVS